jgi:hypothetical protein
MELEVFDAFRSAGVPDDKARAAVESINRQIDRRYSLHAEQLVTRGDLRAEMATLREEISELRTELRTEIAGLRTELHTQIAQLDTGLRTEVTELRTELRMGVADVHTGLRGELLAKIAETKTDVIQWCVGSVFASVGMFAGITRLLCTSTSMCR